ERPAGGPSRAVAPLARRTVQRLTVPVPEAPMVRFSAVLATVLAVLVSGTACTPPRTPAEVSGLFWQAVRDRDAESVRRLSSSRSAPPAGDVEAVLPVGEVTFGRTIIDNDTAWVETTVEVLAEESL